MTRGNQAERKSVDFSSWASRHVPTSFTLTVLEQRARACAERQRTQSSSGADALQIRKPRSNCRREAPR